MAKFKELVAMEAGGEWKFGDGCAQGECLVNMKAEIEAMHPQAKGRW